MNRISALGLVLLLVPAALGAAPKPQSAAIAVETSRSLGAAEEVLLSPHLIERLALSAVGSTVEVADWPVAPGARAKLSLRRIDVYAPEARIYVVDGSDRREAPRSRWAFWHGENEDRSLVIAVDSQAGTIRQAWTGGAGGDFVLTPQVPGEHRLLLAAAETAGGGFRCGVAEGRQSTGSRRPHARSAAPLQDQGIQIQGPAISSLQISSLHQAVFAVDTDTEFFLGRFGGDAAAAADYIASLFAVLQSIYERDVLVRPLQGTTFLRQTDSYEVTGSPASPEQLDEVRDFWNSTPSLAAIPRALTVILSGKGPVSGFSGFADISGLCNDQAYTLSQVQGAHPPSTADTFVVAHEIGHNFGSHHTHCRADSDVQPFIDTCWSGEPSGGGFNCYSGPTACPLPATYSGIPDVRGTLMSYCHRKSGCGTHRVFHPRSLDDYIDPTVAAAVGSCVFPMSRMEGLSFYSLTPCRVVDTRADGQPIQGPALAAGEERVWVLAGQCGLPSAASGLVRSVSLNITVTQPGAPGSLSFTAGDLAPPMDATTLSFSAGQTRANNAVLPLSITPTEGAVRVKNLSAAAVHVVVDVNGYFGPDAP